MRWVRACPFKAASITLECTVVKVLRRTLTIIHLPLKIRLLKSIIYLHILHTMTFITSVSSWLHFCNIPYFTLFDISDNTLFLYSKAELLSLSSAIALSRHFNASTNSPMEHNANPLCDNTIDICFLSAFPFALRNSSNALS
jgi:hypothetical protein